MQNVYSILGWGVLIWALLSLIITPILMTIADKKKTKLEIKNEFWLKDIKFKPITVFKLFIFIITSGLLLMAVILIDLYHMRKIRLIREGVKNKIFQN
jgi:hypothetical protein